MSCLCLRTYQACSFLKQLRYLMSCLNLGALCVCCKALPLHKLSITEKVVQAVQSMLLPQEGSLSIHTSLPASGDGASPVMAVVRLLAEIRTRSEPQCILYWHSTAKTRMWKNVSLYSSAMNPYGIFIVRVFDFVRACLVMAQLLEDSSFCEEFIQQCPAAVEVLNLIAQECSPGECWQQ